jgi:hypothetical protein
MHLPHRSLYIHLHTRLHTMTRLELICWAGARVRQYCLHFASVTVSSVVTPQASKHELRANVIRYSVVSFGIDATCCVALSCKLFVRKKEHTTQLVVSAVLNGFRAVDTGVHERASPLDRSHGE